MDFLSLYNKYAPLLLLSMDFINREKRQRKDVSKFVLLNFETHEILPKRRITLLARAMVGHDIPGEVERIEKA